MIRIKKPRKIPEILKNKGKKEKLKMCKAYENEGVTEFEFNQKIYADKTVKETLIKAQHDKCFLCESKITHIDYGDVEHFRPKKAYCQSEEENLNRPGYFWLAYDWKNLFLACKLCNQRHKRNLFPLENPIERSVSPSSDLKKEKPLFINPAEENPEKYISFRIDEQIGVIPYPIEDNPKGSTTIKNAGLNRLKLCERRFEHSKDFITLFKLASMNLPQPESDQAKVILQKRIADHIKDSAEYAGMFRSLVKILK